MRFDTIIRSASAASTEQARANSLSCGLFLSIFTFTGSLSVAQKTADTSEPPEMLATEEGFLAINSPKGWDRTGGPGLACFIPHEETKAQPRVRIYISSAPIGPKGDAKDLKEYIQSDIAGFRQRFKGGIVQKEPTLTLPALKLQVPVYIFKSGVEHNAIEQVVYIGELNRVLILVLTAREKPLFEKALLTFREFAKSYRGSITLTSAPN